MISRTKTNHFKLLASLLLLVLLVGWQSAIAQTINLEVRPSQGALVSSGSYGSNCGGNDCGGFGNEPDPRIQFRAKHSGTASWGGTYTASADDVGCGTWLGYAGTSQFTGIGIANTVNVQINGYEADGFLSGGDDGNCGGLGSPNSGANNVSITSISPCAYSAVQTSFRSGCASDDVTETYGARWQWRWTWNEASLSDANSGGPIALSVPSEATICAGGDPNVINNSVSPRDPDPTTGAIENVQWQQRINAGGFTDIGGATATTYNPGVLNLVGGVTTTYTFRRRVQFCRDVDDIFGISLYKDIYSNQITITVKPDPNDPTADKAPNANQVCPGTSLTLQNPQYGTESGASCAFEYQSSINGGSTWSASSPAAPSVTATGSDNRIRVRVSACGNGCAASNWVEYAWLVVTDTTAPVVSGLLSICEGTGTSLTANAPLASTVRWYSNPGLTTLENVGPTFNTPSLTTTTTYYVTQTQGTCESAATPVTVTVTPSSGSAIVLTATPNPVTAGNTASLSSTSSSTIWYSDAGITRVGTGTTYNTNPLFTTTTFYGRDSAFGACATISSVVVNVLACNIPGPTVTGDFTCFNGNATLTATPNNGQNTVHWYEGSDVGSFLASGTTYVTPNLTQNTYYYVREDDGAGCLSEPVQVLAQVNAYSNFVHLVDNVVGCTGQPLTLNFTVDAPAPDTAIYFDVFIYNSSSVQIAGGSFGPINQASGSDPQVLTLFGFAAGDYSIDVRYRSVGHSCIGAVSLGTFQVLETPLAPVGQNAGVCEGDVVTLSVTADPGATVKWYADASLEVPINFGAQHITTPITSNTSYWVTQTVGGCESPATQIDVTLLQVMPDPAVSNTVVCAGSAATLTGAGAGGQWSTDPDFVDIVGSGDSYTTPALAQTTTFYVRTLPETGAFCPSAIIPVTVSVINDPSNPTVTASSVCAGSSATITIATSENGMVVLSAADGTPLDSVDVTTAPTSVSFTVAAGSIPSAGTYTFLIIQRGATGCLSSPVAVVVNVTDAPAAPAVTSSNNPICSGDYADRRPVLAAVTASLVPGASVYWYNTATATVPVHEGRWFEVPQAALGFNFGNAPIRIPFWVRQSVNGCLSDTARVTVVLNPEPTYLGFNVDPFYQPVCFGGIAEIALDTTGRGNSTFYWALDPSLSSASFITDPTLFTTPQNYNLTTYYIIERNQYGCYAREFNYATALVEPVIIPSVTVPDVQPVCEGEDVVITVTLPENTDDIVVGIPGGPVIYTGSTTGFGGGTFTLTIPGAAFPPGGGDFGLYVENYSDLGCESERTYFNVHINARPDAPAAEPVTTCIGQPAFLTAEGEQGADIRWYPSDDLINAVQVGAEYTTPPLSQNTTYYVTQSLNGCESDPAIVDVTVNPAPELPFGTQGYTICLGQTVPPGEGLQGNCSGTVAPPVITTVSIPVAVTSTPLPVVIGPDALFAGTISFDASSIPAGATINKVTLSVDMYHTWAADIYLKLNSPAATSVDVTDPGWTTGGSSNYGASAGVAANYIFDDAAVDYPQPIGTANYIPSGSYKSYDLLSAFNGQDPSGTWTLDVVDLVGSDDGFLNAATINIDYTLGSTSTANVPAASVTPPIIPIGPDAGSPQTITFDATALPSGATVTKVTIDVKMAHTWGGDVKLDLASPLSSIQLVNNNGVGSDNYGTGGTSPLLYTFDDAAAATITAVAGSDIPAGSYKPNQALSGFNGQSPQGTWTLTADDLVDGDGGTITAASITITYSEPGASTGNTITWWDAPAGGTQVGSGNPFVPAQYDTLAPGNYTFYAQCDSNSTCANTRVPVIFTVLPAITAPVVNQVAPICVGETVTLTVNNPASQVEWYADSNLTILLHVGSVYTTQPLGSNTTIYVVNNNGTCNSAATQVDIIVNPRPELPEPTVDGYVYTCFDTPVAVSVDNPNEYIINWYADKGGEVLLTNHFNPDDENGTFTTPEISSWTIFYYDATDPVTGCRSVMGNVEVKSRPKFEAPRVQDITVCQSENPTDSITLIAHVTFPDDILWDDDDYNDYLISAVQFYDNLGNPIGDPQSIPLLYGSLDATATLTISPADYGYDVAGTYQIEAQTFTIWPEWFNDDREWCYSDYGTGTLTVVPTPEAPSARGTVICADNSTRLVASGQDSASFFWYDDQALTHVVQEGAEYITPTLSNTTSYWVTQTVDGCQSAATEVVVTVNALPETPAPTSNAPLCEGATLELFANVQGDYTYLWTGPNGFTSTEQNPTIADVTEANNQGVYTLVITDTETGCPSLPGTTYVEIYPTPEPPSISSNSPLCEGEDLILTASAVDGATEYNWYGPGDVLLGTTTDPTFTVPAITVAQAGLYSVTVTVNGCVSQKATTTVVVKPKPAAPIVPADPVQVCEGEDVSFCASTPEKGAVYNWYGPNGFEANTNCITLSNVTPVQSGWYKVCITVDGCRSEADSVLVIVNAAPVADSV
ncbi:MAG: proprotein convertase P-domain-containing protein [Sphingobacteriales bacterium]|nr:proprotein convertase P-domain-containing protein [Sphingobacteriales bacterium]